MERRDRSGNMLLIRAAGVGASALGLTLARYSGHFRPSAETLSFLLMAAGIVLAGESEGISRWFELDVPEFPEIHVEQGDVVAPLKERRFKAVRRPRKPEPPKERAAARGLVEVALVIASGFAVCCVAPSQQQDGGIVPQIVDTLRHWQPPVQPGPMPPIAGPGAPVTLQLEPPLRDAVIAYLARQMTPEQGSTWGGMSGVELVLLVLIAVAVIVLLFKKPKEAAVVGAAALSGAAIKEADHLSNLGPVLYWFVVVVYLVVSIVALLWLGVLIYERMERAAAVAVGGGAPHAPGDKKKEGGDPFLAAGVSVVILLWTVVMVGYRHAEAVEKKNAEVVTKPVEVKPSAVAVVSEMLPSTLTATVRFAPGEPETALHPDAEWAQTAELRDDLNRMAQRGDELLLLGSTDCTSYRSEKSGNNAALARRRADAVFESVKATAEAKGVFVQMAPLRQHEACKGSPDQRTVFSILLRPKAGQ